MKRFSLITITLATAAFLAACGAPADNKPATNANATNANAVAKPAAAAPTKDSLMAIEKSGWEAWKNHDNKFWADFYSDKYVGFGPDGQMNKAAAVKSLEEGKHVVKSYSLSDDQMMMAGPDVAVLTYKAAQDYTMNDGKPGPKEVWSAAVYLREGDKWRCALYAETPVVDPKAPPKPAPARKDEAKKEEAKPDAATDALLAIERKIWEAWKAKDGKPLEDILGKDFIFFGGQGRSDRATTIKNWTTDNKCEVKSFTLSNAMSVSLTKDVSILTYKGGAAGKCEGQPIPTEWYVGLYMKEGEAWKESFGMGVSQ